eukprot:Gregarina_sp_Pseudo_9__5849@NODE_902_length_2074_cov_30_806388_g847_i0_p1_GENE_NODE_902_length_2074_cov_30_806388_g847_i0NODE_902_length_2074_cov_30_806388_g847_i0_p1_ORF_typecomplete_len357_score28_90ADH_N/PF08240_12/1_4e26ADH_zinc_N/PF00107_26/2e18Glu_dehyd_C/PF16912_5/8_7e102Hacid_dh_C/PF02826_19/3_2e06AlaDh_PNT_C/PF01262_21/7_4e06Shikimate_DH/PF01488_20/0_0013GFO_IDH_MocA/PF01408_22/0_15GFO_IDH_MocA/PF01408_22/1_8e04AdoHcyase_NAD/PF00670_21/0_13_NODE_902_length_2074_cov_30_806388_g847_i03371
MSAIATKGLAAFDASAEFRPHTFKIHALRPKDVHVQVHFCGMCHSDLHYASNEWLSANYPCVPGHEITGKVVAIGNEVTKFKVDQHVAVGVIINSCKTCNDCAEDLPQYCLKRVKTYGSPSECPDQKEAHPFTTGGYGKDIVVDEDFVFAVPDELPMDKLGPLLCAGATVYSPMKFFACDKSGKTVGVVGLGGLGHMAVQFGAAWNNKVVVFSTNASKQELAKKLGAHDFVVVSDEVAMRSWANSVDIIIDTACVGKDLTVYLNTLKRDGKHVLVGIPPAGEASPLVPGPLILQRRSIYGSTIASNVEIREMLALCASKKILPMTELILPSDINKAVARMRTNDVKFRFVIDMRNI